MNGSVLLCRTILTLCLVTMLPAVVLAHQMQVALSTVTFKERTGTIEVIHRFYTHDAEHAMSAMQGRRVDIILYEDVQQGFGDHVSANFQLLGDDKQPLPLDLVGVEVDGHFIWVYQEAPLPESLKELAVVNSALLDLVPGQVNTVNVECSDTLTTVTFSGEIRAAAVAMDLSTCPFAESNGAPVVNERR